MTSQGTRDMDRIAGQVRTTTSKALQLRTFQHLRIPKMLLAVIKMNVPCVKLMNLFSRKFKEAWLLTTIAWVLYACGSLETRHAHPPIKP